MSDSIQKARPKNEAGSDIFPQHLIELSIRGLKEMFDEGNMLFCYRMKRTDKGLKKEGFSYRYTLISLLGLCQFQAHGFKQSLDLKQALGKLIDNRCEINNLGDLGLLIWLCALASPERLANVFCGLDVENALERYGDALLGRTMELSWFLAGLCHTAVALNKALPSLDRVVLNTYRMILENYGGNGIFGHQNRKTFGGKMRGRIGTFADQVYPIYAFSAFTQVYGDKEALRIALDCSDAICKLQGPLGQWWWHYDSATGNMIGRYPVFAVHQDGMAPMALLTIGKIAGTDFLEPIYKGISWVTGDNELNQNLVDSKSSLIWRSVSRKNFKQYSELGSSFLGANRVRKVPSDLRVNFECRPYHLGWVLYASSLTNST